MNSKNDIRIEQTVLTFKLIFFKEKVSLKEEKVSHLFPFCSGFRHFFVFYIFVSFL